MTIPELSNEFDSLLLSHISKLSLEYQGVLEFDEYQKSVLLTKALEDTVRDYFTGRNSMNLSFELTEELRKALEALVTHRAFITSTLQTPPNPTLLQDGLKHFEYDLSSNDTYPTCWFIIYEQVTWGANLGCISGKTATVIPVTHDTYSRTKDSPFRGPNNRKVLRLTKGENLVELVSTNTIGTYTVRYVSKPSPIILVDLEDGLTIDGETLALTCKLSDSIHRLILDKAITYALLSISISNKSNGK